MNRNLPAGISALRAFSSKAQSGTINLGLGKPHQDMPPPLRELASSLMANGSLRMDYSENAGLQAVRMLLEEHYRLGENTTLLTHGAQEGLFATFLALLNPGDEVLLPNPGFLAYAPMLKSLQAKPVFYQLKKSGSGFEYSLPEILGKVNRKTKAILINSPANPTGSLMSADALRELAESLPKVTILSDEVYGELHYKEPYIPFCRYAKNVVSINAFSKSHALTGWRIGWVGSQNAALLRKILVAHQYISTCASVPAQHLVGALLGDDVLFDSIRDRYCAEYVARRNVLFRELGDCGVEPPLAGFYAFLPIPKRFGSSLKFAEHLLEKKKLLVIPGEFFGSLGKRFVRFSYAASMEDVRAGAKIYRESLG